MSDTHNVNTGKVGLAFWTRSRSGRSMTLWVCVREVESYKSDYTGLTYRRWLVRELIRGGVGPVHGKALRKCWTISYHGANVLAESEYTDEIKALVEEAMAFEQGIDHVPGGTNWYEHRRAVAKQYDANIRSIYEMFGLKHNNRLQRRKNSKFEVETTSGNGLSLYAEFEDEIRAREFVKTLFARKYAQQARITDKFDNSVQRFRRKKHKDYQPTHFTD